MIQTRDGHAGALQRFDAAREERDRRADQYDAACGSGSELPAYTDLKAAEDQLAAREAWLEWTKSDY